MDAPHFRVEAEILIRGSGSSWEQVCHKLEQAAERPKDRGESDGVLYTLVWWVDSVTAARAMRARLHAVGGTHATRWREP